MPTTNKPTSYARHITHGMYGTREYRAWRNMLNRCTNPNVRNYPDYGGRGITVCELWARFENFYSDMGVCPPGMSLERKRNQEGYSPDNCIWAPLESQARNKRNNRPLTFQGRTMILSDWAKEMGLKKTTVHMRIEKGWTVEAALSTPAR